MRIAIVTYKDGRKMEKVSARRLQQILAIPALKKDVRNYKYI